MYYSEIINYVQTILSVSNNFSTQKGSRNHDFFIVLSEDQWGWLSVLEIANKDGSSLLEFKKTSKKLWYFIQYYFRMNIPYRRTKPYHHVSLRITITEKLRPWMAVYFKFSSLYYSCITQLMKGRTFIAKMKQSIKFELRHNYHAFTDLSSA